MRRISTLCWLLSPVLFVATAAIAAPTSADSSLGLRAKDDVTDLQKMRIEAENEVQIRFERPRLNVDLDPATAPGLQWGSILDVLDRTEVDLTGPLLATSASEANPYLARPWLDGFQSGEVAHFRPALEGVAAWSLMIADSRGRTVRTFSGKGKPPEAIGWDGRAEDGSFAPVGLVYSYVLEATDRAGNKRNFVGDSFELPPYRADDDDHPHFLFTGAQVTSDATPALLLVEVASRINRIAAVQRGVRIQVTARSHAEGEALARRIATWLEPRVIDGSRRLMSTVDIAQDAPATGSVQIVLND